LDATHPLHGLPSAGPAGEGLRGVYRATDRLVRDLIASFGDAVVIVLLDGRHGPEPVGCREHAAPAGAALPPRVRTCAPAAARGVDRGAGIPQLGESGSWSARMISLIPEPRSDAAHGALRRALSRSVPETVKGVARRIARRADAAPDRSALGWMPAARYRAWWHAMPAFALPSFYDGRVRVNLVGRESRGKVAASEYERTCDAIEALVRACRDPATGESVVDFVERPADGRDPRAIGDTEADLVFVWKGALAFDHPRSDGSDRSRSGARADTRVASAWPTSAVRRSRPVISACAARSTWCRR
jgi:hypothetical protein